MARSGGAIGCILALLPRLALAETPPALNVADTSQSEPPYVLMSGGELEALRAAGRIEAFLARYR